MHYSDEVYNFVNNKNLKLDIGLDTIGVEQLAGIYYEMFKDEINNDNFVKALKKYFTITKGMGKLDKQTNEILKKNYGIDYNELSKDISDLISSNQFMYENELDDKIQERTKIEKQNNSHGGEYYNDESEHLL